LTAIGKVLSVLLLIYIQYCINVVLVHVERRLVLIAIYISAE